MQQLNITVCRLPLLICQAHHTHLYMSLQGCTRSLHRRHRTETSRWNTAPHWFGANWGGVAASEYCMRLVVGHQERRLRRRCKQRSLLEQIQIAWRHPHFLQTESTESIMLKLRISARFYRHPTLNCACAAVRTYVLRALHKMGCSAHAIHSISS